MLWQRLTAGGPTAVGAKERRYREKEMSKLGASHRSSGEARKVRHRSGKTRAHGRKIRSRNDRALEQDQGRKFRSTRAPTGLPLPRLALPEIDEPGEIARYLFGDGLPGEFPYSERRLSRDVSRAAARDRNGQLRQRKSRRPTATQTERREREWRQAKPSRRKSRRASFPGSCSRKIRTSASIS